MAWPHGPKFIIEETGRNLFAMGKASWAAATRRSAAGAGVCVLRLPHKRHLYQEVVPAASICHGPAARIAPARARFLCVPPNTISNSFSSKEEREWVIHELFFGRLNEKPDLFAMPDQYGNRILNVLSLRRWKSIFLPFQVTMKAGY